MLVVAPQPVYQDRGTPIAVAHVLKALSELGCAVDVLTFPIGTDVPLPGVTWHRVGNPFGFRRVPVGLSFRKIVLDVLLAFRLARMVRRTRYDYVHAVEEAAFLAATIGRRAGVPLLYDMQCSIPQHLSRRALFGARLSQAFLRGCERWLLSRADLVVASAGLAEYVNRTAPSAQVEEWRYPAAVWAESPDGSAELRAQLGLSDDARTVVYMGTFEEYQGLAALVEAARNVVEERPETVFIAVGGEPARAAQLEALVRRRGVDQHFRVIPREPRERALAYIRLADVVVSPRAHGNNLPLKIADYMAATKPIVATRIPAHTSILDSTRAVLTDTDGDSMAGGILRVLGDSREAARLAAAARAYGDEHLSWPAFLDSVRGHVHRLVSPGEV